MSKEKEIKEISELAKALTELDSDLEEEEDTEVMDADPSVYESTSHSSTPLSSKLHLAEEPHFAFVVRRVADNVHGNDSKALGKFAADKKVLDSWSAQTPYPVIRSVVGDEASGWAKSAVSQLMMKFRTPSDMFAADKMIDGEQFLKITKDNLQNVLKWEYKMMHQALGDMIEDMHSIADPVVARDAFKRMALETKGIWMVLVRDDKYNAVPFDIWIDEMLSEMLKSPDEITGFIYRIEGVLEYALDK